MRCIVVDDEEMSREIIRKFIERTDFLEFAGAFSNAIDASNAIRKDVVDIIFLDIQMPEMTGMELIRSLHNPPQIILITSEEKYAVEAFEYEVADYLLKPPSYPRFLKAVNKVVEKKDSQNAEPIREDKNVFIKVDSKLVKLDSEDILFVEALGDYVVIHTSEKKFTVYSTMKAIEQNLNFPNFLRVHRSFIINIDKINDIQEGNLLIKGTIIPIGGSYRNDLMKRLKII